ncbi:HalOD1 output domain-containing protein [Halomicrobium urmianum]|uniref:HalOD1 output domain-containing protein n=1 Tax=Halomicrobium urmianum TaxID=1586233 RepID=UPI001CD9CFBC
MDNNSTSGGDDRSASLTEYTYEIGRDEAPSVAVVRTVCALTDTEPTDLEPLYETIDPEGLDGIFTGAKDTAGPKSLSFEFGGCDVTVTYDEIRVSLPDEGTQS